MHNGGGPLVAPDLRTHQLRGMLRGRGTMGEKIGRRRRDASATSLVSVASMVSAVSFVSAISWARWASRASCTLSAILAFAAPLAAEPHIVWQVENPFRLFLDSADTKLHRATWLSLSEAERARGVSAAERLLGERHAD